MVVMSWHIPVGAPNPNDTVGAVCFVDKEQRDGALQLVTSKGELARIITEHTFMSQAAVDRYVQALLSSSLPESSGTPTESLLGQIPLMMNSSFTALEEMPQLRARPRERWGGYLATNLPAMVIFAYVDKSRVHHIAYFTDYPAVQDFCLRTHIHEVPHTDLAVLLTGGEYLPKKAQGAVRIFHGKLAELLAEGVRIRQAMHRAPSS